MVTYSMFCLIFAKKSFIKTYKVTSNSYFLTSGFIKINTKKKLINIYIKSFGVPIVNLTLRGKKMKRNLLLFLINYFNFFPKEKLKKIAMIIMFLPYCSFNLSIKVSLKKNFFLLDLFFLKKFSLAIQDDKFIFNNINILPLIEKFLEHLQINEKIEFSYKNFKIIFKSPDFLKNWSIENNSIKYKGKEIINLNDKSPIKFLKKLPKISFFLEISNNIIYIRYNTYYFKVQEVKN